jgi:60 kDa SS-A/Ro ribonucleoprotein
MATTAYRRANQQLFGAAATPQKEPMRADQVANDAGGYVWAVTDRERVDRFLFLGSEGGTYYTEEQPLTVESAKAVLSCIKDDGVALVDRLVEVSVSGAARKNTPCLFALALAIAKGDDATRLRARAALPRIARTASDMLQFVQFTDDVRGWGRGLRKGIASWYDGKSVSSLAYQVVKYRERAGWSHRDVLRMAHANPGADEARQILYRYAAKGWDAVGEEPHEIEALRQVWAYERLQVVANQSRPDLDQVTDLIRSYRLPWEAVPTNLLKNHAVQDALLESMPVGAMLRQLGRMTANDFLTTEAPARVATVVERLTDMERLRKARIHPISVLAAMRVYQQGHGGKGKLRWSPVGRIVDALDEAFYLTFGALEPIGKRVLWGLDISSSMHGTKVQGIENLSATEACGALALVAARTEQDNRFIAFNDNAYEVAITGRQRLDDATRVLGGMTRGGTNCALPITKALEMRIPVDLFTILTDSQSWVGPIHPKEAIDRYRREMGIPARLAVVAMATNQFSLADPNDSGMMNLIGMDTNLPSLLRAFAHGFAIPSTASATEEEQDDELVAEGVA